MNEATACFQFRDSPTYVLDVCMAPGGFSQIALQSNTGNVRIDAFSLPEDDGVYRVMVPRHKNMKVCFTDITMLSSELGVTDIAPTHPEATKFRDTWPFGLDRYDLVICDGQALRTHNVADYRKLNEQTRLFNAELVIALQRVKPGGTLLVLLHRLHKYRTFQLLRLFNRFSNITLFKSGKLHADRSSFYLIAKDVQPFQSEALEALELFRASWKRATFSFEESSDSASETPTRLAETDVAEFMPEFQRLATPIWQIQAAALSNAKWMGTAKSEEHRTENQAQ